MNHRIKIKFIEHHAPYCKGELAGFPQAHAANLVRRGVAVYVGDDTNASDAAAIRNLAHPENTRHIPGPENTRHIPGPDQTKGADGKRECPHCKRRFVDLESHISNQHDES